jgi:hypothetical protein
MFIKPIFVFTSLCALIFSGSAQAQTFYGNSSWTVTGVPALIFSNSSDSSKARYVIEFVETKSTFTGDHNKRAGCTGANNGATAGSVKTVITNNGLTPGSSAHQHVELWKHMVFLAKSTKSKLRVDLGNDCLIIDMRIL